MKIITIRNDCQQCGVKLSSFSVDPPNVNKHVPEATRRQKQYIASQHKGHTYKLKVYDGLAKYY